MINFEEELKKFGPSMEIEEVESAVRGHELTDMTDIMLTMMRQQNEAQKANTVPPMGVVPGTTQPMPVIPNMPNQPIV